MNTIWFERVLDLLTDLVADEECHCSTDAECVKHRAEKLLHWAADEREGETCGRRG